MFTAQARDCVRGAVLAMARSDPRVVAGALIGSLAAGPGDRWSDLDLGFGLAAGASPAEVLADWTARLGREFQAVHLFDVASLSTTYRVFLLPGCLQVDVSVTPAAEFAVRGPKFEVLFGRAAAPRHVEPPPARDLFGMGVHHAVRARFCLARGRVWQAQYWIAEVRNQALALACRRRGLDVRYGRGYDQLPPEILERCKGTLVRSVEPGELLRALGRAIDELLREAEEVRGSAAKVEAWLRDLASPAFVETSED